MILYETKDQQNNYLAGCIRLEEVTQRKCEKVFYARNSSYSYYVKVVRDGACIEIKVCFKAMLSLFGITNRRMQTVKSALYETGHSPIDKRGLGPKPWALGRLPVSYQNNKMFYLYWTFASQILGFFENLPIGSNTDPLVSSFDRYEDRSEQIDVEFFT